MDWDERWRLEERAAASDIPETLRNTWPKSKRGQMIFGYFVGLSILFYIAVSTLGTQAGTVAGVPILYWLTVLVYLLFIVGMYRLIYVPEQRRHREDEE